MSKVNMPAALIPQASLTVDQTIDLLDGSMSRETIILELLTGDPQGMRIATFSQTWTGKGFAAPRTELKELLARQEMDSAGVYILLGHDTDPNEARPLAYIGVGKSIRKRLRNRKEEFWTRALVFIGNLHEGQIKYLEGQLIAEARKIAQFKVINEQPSGSPLPDHEIAGMELFLEKMRILLPLLGCNLLVPVSQPKGQILICKIKGLSARGQRSSEGFIVLKGSQAIAQIRPSASKQSLWITNLRNDLVGFKILIPKDDHLVFAMNYEFRSPSAAAAVIRGGNANGLTEWKSEEGITLKELDNAV